jgi:release factor glutamine methyltransferase
MPSIRLRPSGCGPCRPNSPGSTPSGNLTGIVTSSIVSTLRAAGCVFAEDEAELLISAAHDDAELAHLVEQRVAGLPIEHVVGFAEFRGLRILLDAGVFVPRRRTEHLVAEAIALSRPGAVVVDLCCGSGALGVAIAAAQSIDLYAADIEPAAVRCARRNVEPIGGQVFEGDLYAALPASLRGRVDLLLSNVPYVPSGEVRLLPAEARLHEPLVTLDGGDDGLEVLRRVSAEAAQWLAAGGSVFVETSEVQAAIAAEIFAKDGLRARVSTSAELYATVVIGTKE